MAANVIADIWDEGTTWSKIAKILSEYGFAEIGGSGSILETVGSMLTTEAGWIQIAKAGARAARAAVAKAAVLAAVIDSAWEVYQVMN